MREPLLTSANLGLFIMTHEQNPINLVAKMSMVVAVSILGCKRVDNTQPAISWRQDPAPVMTRIPSIGTISACRWHAGVAVDGSSGGLPSPSSYYIRGYATLPREKVKELLQHYRWSADPNFVPEQLPSDSSYRKPTGTWLVSPQFVSDLATSSDFHSGRVGISETDLVIYFDLQN